MTVQDTVLDSRAARPPKVEPAPTPRTQPPHAGLIRLIDIGLLAILFFVPAYMALHSSAIFDPDIWWHLRTGEWISTHHAVPRAEPFSGPMAGTPWVAYSWLFELLTYELFRTLGVPGLLVYASSLILLITAALFNIVRRGARQLPAAALLTFAAMYSTDHLFTPRPWLFTILFFTLELGIILHVRHTGISRKLIWIPVIFAAWANIHIQFVYGLLVLVIAVTEAMAARRWTNLQTKASPGPLVATLACSVLATLANPYGWRIYAVAHDLATQSGALNTIGELQAIPFRDLANYGALIFALAAAAALGWTRRLLSFECALLVFAAVISFRSQRDAWLVAIVGAAILSDLFPPIRKPNLQASKYLIPSAIAIAAVFLVIALRSPELNNSRLRERQAERLPVRAVDFVREHGYPGPLFNDFNWGGYLIWNLRMPVSMDGRQNVYGDERIDRSVATWNGEPGWQTDPALQAAGIVIGPSNSPLMQLLQTDQHFQLAYRDKLAAVFVARR